MLYTLATRSTMSINVLHERNPLFVQLADGGVRNDYTVRLLNKGMARSFAIEVSGLPGATARIAGIERQPDGRLIVEVGQDQTREIRMSVQVPPAQLPKSTVNVEIESTDIASGQSATARDHFVPADR
jgi:polyferredoxin